MNRPRDFPPQTIDYVRANGQTIEEMRENLFKDPKGNEIYNRGDTILVWVNEGDIDIHNMNIMLGTLHDNDDGV